MSLKDEFASLTTISQVYDFRERLHEQVKTLHYHGFNAITDLETLSAIQEANFFAARCDNLIKYAERRGAFLPKIEGVNDTEPEEIP